MKKLSMAMLVCAGCVAAEISDVPDTERQAYAAATINLPQFFHRGADGNLYHVSAAMFGGWFFQNWTSLAGAPAAAGPPVSMATTNPSQAHVFYRSTSGTIHHVYYDSAFHQDDFTSAAGAPLAAGDPAVVRLSTIVGMVDHVFYRDTSGHLRHIMHGLTGFTQNDWTALTGAPAMLGNPAVTANNHVFIRGSDEHIYHLFFDGATYHREDWTATVGAPLAAGDPAAMPVDTQPRVFYRGVDAHLHMMTQASWLLHQDWTAMGAAGAAGDPAAMYVVNTYAEYHVFYRGSDGHLAHAYFLNADGQLRHDDWTQQSGAPAPVGRVSIGFSNPGNQSLVQRDASGNLGMISWDGAFHFSNLTQLTQSPAAAGDPSACIVSL